MSYRLDRCLIHVSGPDARPFLQGLLTQNLDKLDDAGVLYAALLSPQGKLVADMFLWPTADGGVLIDADPARGGDLMRRLTMYKLRAQVMLADVSDARSVLYDIAPFDGASPDPRLAALGWRKFGALVHDDDGAARLAQLMLTKGVPDLARDAAPEEVFGLEALLEELHSVDFAKGCFVGQENVSRMKRRATTRKKFCPIVFEGDAPPYGAPVLAGAAEVGSVRTGGLGRAMALLRLDRALEAPDALHAGGRHVRLDPPAWLILPRGDNVE